MTILVVAAVIVDKGQVLVTQRPAGSNFAGLWEFPGGKVEKDEDPRDALQRELREEIGVDADVGDILEATFHRYETRNILLLFFHTTIKKSSPSPQPIEVNAIAWRKHHELIDEHFPPADIKVLHRVRKHLSRL